MQWPIKNAKKVNFEEDEVGRYKKLKQIYPLINIDTFQVRTVKSTLGGAPAPVLIPAYMKSCHTLSVTGCQICFFIIGMAIQNNKH